MHSYLLSLGSNLGERLENLSRAVLLLSRRGEIQDASAVYETSPVDSAGEDFLNCAVRFHTYLEPPALLQFIHEIEQTLGRKNGEKSEPRPIDIDIILWSGGDWNSGDLVIPHPQADKRMFVMTPVNEIAPDTFPRKKLRSQRIERFCGPDILFLKNA